jgi:uncharacterized protein (DUF2336 family)
VNSYSSEQVSLFDDVISRLITDIEKRVLAELAARLAPIENAPAGVIQRLARDDDITIAGPVLQKSECLTDENLIEIAGSKGQEHLLEISHRAGLNEAVTDVLVERGNADVANEVAANEGARFSKSGLSRLAIRAETDDTLTANLAGRPDIPPLLLRHILSRATDTARQRLLMSARPETREAIRKIMADICRQMTGQFIPRGYAQAQRAIAAISQDTELTKAKLREFAAGHRFEEMVVALSVLSVVPIDLVDHLLNNPSPFGAMVLCRAIALGWHVAEAVIRARPATEVPSEAEGLAEEYQLLSVPSAQRLLRFWQVQQDRPAVAERKMAPPTPEFAISR